MGDYIRFRVLNSLKRGYIGACIGQNSSGYLEGC